MGTQSDALWAGITAVSFENQQDKGDDWTEAGDALANQDTPREITPTTRPQSPVIPKNDVPPAADPAYDAQPPTLSIPPNGNHAGIFQGRIVYPYGFDAEKVVIPVAFLNPADIGSDCHLTATFTGQWRPCSTKYRTQQFHSR
jgi:hypothetical protein